MTGAAYCQSCGHWHEVRCLAVVQTEAGGIQRCPCRLGREEWRAHDGGH
ncbi:hypothetical protein SEA_BASILISK_63 [Arthrobacter phage Basilisk]|nr:hypothetical protein SEA_BASILISK_63 [Arthrobacter phage Basilisk]